MNARHWKLTLLLLLPYHLAFFRYENLANCTHWLSVLQKRLIIVYHKSAAEIMFRKCPLAETSNVQSHHCCAEKVGIHTYKDPSKSNTCELVHAFICGDKNRILNNSKQFMLQLLLCKSLWMHEIFCGGGGHWRESHPKICKFFFGLDFSFVDVVVLFILLRRKSQQQHIISCFHRPILNKMVFCWMPSPNWSMFPLLVIIVYLCDNSSQKPESQMILRWHFYAKLYPSKTRHHLPLQLHQ